MLARIATALALTATAPLAFAQEGGLWKKVADSGVLICGAIPGDPVGSWKVPGKDEWLGYEIGLCRAIAADLGKAMGKTLKIEFHETTWKTVVLDIQSGKIDLWPGMTATEERKRAIDMAGPMYQLPNCMVNRKGLPAMPNWVDYNYPKLRIATVTGTVTERAIRTELAPNAVNLSFKDLTEATLAVQSGRADSVGLDILRCLSAMKAAKDLFGGIVFPEPIRATGSSAGMRKDNDGRLHTFVQRWSEESAKNGVTKKVLLDAMAAGGFDITMLPENVRF
ncbi:MAG: transporter substrate-binding domain-containing protein [Lautropia sp.]